MNLMTSSYCGSIWHHGIKGQKWGVRRTPEELGRRPKGADGIEKTQKRVKIVDGVYHSEKGFTIAEAKLSKYCLNPKQKHAKEFFGLGYTPNDSDMLFRHIEEGFDMSKRKDERKGYGGSVQFLIPMELGVSSKRIFTTSWQIDKESDSPRMTSAYMDRRNKEGV